MYHFETSKICEEYLILKYTTYLSPSMTRKLYFYLSTDVLYFFHLYYYKVRVSSGHNNGAHML